MDIETIKTEIEQDEFTKKDIKDCLFFQLKETNKKIISLELFILENLKAPNFEQMTNHVNTEIMILKETKKFITNQIINYKN